MQFHYIKKYSGDDIKDRKIKYSISRNNELRSLALNIQNPKQITLLVGENGVGKTTLVKELEFQIKKHNLLKTGKKQEIIYFNLDKLCDNNSYVYNEEIENEINKIDYAINHNAILFIDNIAYIKKNYYDIFNKIKKNVEENNLKVIGTITSEQDDDFFKTDLFSKIIIDELDNDALRLIINKKFIESCKKYGIKRPSEGAMFSIESFLLAISKRQIEINNICKKYKTEDINDFKVINNLHNPKLIIEIIESIFIDVKNNDNNLLTKQNFINGVNNCKYCWKEQFVSDYINWDIHNQDSVGIYIYETDKEICHKERVKIILKSRM